MFSVSVSVVIIVHELFGVWYARSVCPVSQFTLFKYLHHPTNFYMLLQTSIVLCIYLVYVYFPCWYLLCAALTIVLLPASLKLFYFTLDYQLREWAGWCVFKCAILSVSNGWLICFLFFFYHHCCHTFNYFTWNDEIKFNAFNWTVFFFVGFSFITPFCTYDIQIHTYDIKFHMFSRKTLAVTLFTCHTIFNAYAFNFLKQALLIRLVDDGDGDGYTIPVVSNNCSLNAECLPPFLSSSHPNADSENVPPLFRYSLIAMWQIL